METFASEIRRLRKAAGMTQEVLAEKMEVTQSTITHLETGRNSAVSLSVYFALCDALGVSTEHFRPYLVTPDAPPPPPAKKPKK